MNSLTNSNWTKYVALTVLAVALSSGFANAQDVAGKFNLPFEARWGNIVLTPGQYSFTYGPLVAGGIQVIELYRNKRGVAMIQATPALEGQFSNPSHLSAVRVEGGYRITALQLSDPGMKLIFTIPQGEMLEARETASSVKDVPILRAAK